MVCHTDELTAKWLCMDLNDDFVVTKTTKKQLALWYLQKIVQITVME